MAIYYASVSNFNLTSTWTVAYNGSYYSIAVAPNTDSADKTFDFTAIPAGSTINSATLTATMNSPATGAALRTVDGGSFSGSKGVSITPGGSNTFRFRFKANGSASAPTGAKSSTLSFSDVAITVDYNPPGGGSSGGGATPPAEAPYIGNLAVSPTAIAAGGSLYIATGSCYGNLIRHISVYRSDTNAFVATVVAGYGIEAGAWMFPIPVEWCEFAPNDTQFQLRIELYAHYPDGGWGGVENKTVTIYVPDDIKPTIGSLTAAYNANGVNGAITKYVQNYSKTNLAMGSVSGVYGSSIISYEISGGGLSAWSSSATLGPFAQSGSITITAKVVDSRGRVGLKTVAISVEPYSAISVNNLQAYRSDASKNPADEGAFATLIGNLVFSSIGGQNTGTINGRVYEKGTTAPSWTTMADNTLVLFGGSLSVEKAYTAEISINDLITSYLYSVDIPTGTVIIGIASDGDGVSFGTYPEAGKVKSVWPIEAPNFYPIGAIYMSISDTSPATLFGGTWAAIDAGRFLVAAGTGYPAGDTGGQSSFSLTGENLPNIAFDVLAQGSGSNTWGLPAPTSGGTAGWVPGYVRSGGSGNAISIIPPWYAVYMWRRTA